MAAFYKNPVYLLAMVVGVAAVFVLTSPEDKPKKTVAPHTNAVTAKKQATELQPVDYTIKFPAVTSPAKNLFKPLVAKQVSGGSAAPTGPTGIPAALAGGEGNWIYSGMAVVDGVSTALVENSTTSVSVFLKRGERWKTCSVIEIKPDEIVLLGPDSERVTVKVKEDSKPAGPVAGQAPVAPALTGDIGSPMAATPDTGTGTGGNGRGRRGGRGRGRGRGNPTDNGNGDGNQE